jgi:DNA-binding IclR family transcriptional regulator
MSNVPLIRTWFHMEERGESMEQKPKLLQSVSNALTILEVLGQHQEIGIADLSRQLGLAKSTVHRLITTLEAHDFAAQNPETGKYHLGLKTVVVAGQALDLMDIRPLIRPILVKLRDKTNETAHLVVRHGNKALFIDKASSSNSIRMDSHVGWQAPLHCTATGKVILAYMPKPEQTQLLQQLELKAYTSNTYTDPSKLAAELEAIKKQGWSCDNEEIELGLYCLAAPIFDRNNELEAAISISGPVTRVKDHANLIEAVKVAARESSAVLGCKQP